jgi:hypothetical protein
MFGISQIVERKWAYIGLVDHPFIDFEKAYISEVLSTSPAEFGISMKLVRLSEMNSKVCIDKHMLLFLFRMV